MGSIHLVQNELQCWVFVNTVMILQVLKELTNWWLLHNGSAELVN
jgi:hypothetical protein